MSPPLTFKQALSYCQQWLSHDPSNETATYSLLSTLARLKRWDDVIVAGRAALHAGKGTFQVHSSLANALGRTGHLEEARRHWTRCLELKDKSVGGDVASIAHVPVPPFNRGDRSRNAISFSLFGDLRKYTEGAVQNAIAARYVYPEWTCRFYVDRSAPQDIIAKLKSEGAVVLRVDGLPSWKFGTFWRFLVADDPAIDRYLVRDCDSVVNVRERLAVEEWLQEGTHFHVMRDYISHTELVLAGMWGGVAGALTSVGDKMIAFLTERVPHRTIDQEFLRSVAWPTMRQSVLCHDSQFSFGSSRAFPGLANLPDGQHVGMAL